jgi:hypothetical protein
MIMLPILYLFFLICLFIVCICNRRQQQTFSNAYHSSVACGRSTGDSAIGHGFGAAALRSNASHICLLVYLCIIFWISHLFLNKKVTRKRGIKFKNGTRFLMNVSPFFSLYFPPPPLTVTRTLTPDTAITTSSQVPHGSLWHEKENERGTKGEEDNLHYFMLGTVF